MTAATPPAFLAAWDACVQRAAGPLPAAVVIGAVAGSIAVVGVLWVERLGIDDPIGAVAVLADSLRPLLRGRPGEPSAR